MANVLYPKWKEALTENAANSDIMSGDVKVALIDTGVAGLPVTPNGGNIIITWNASGIFAL